MFRLLVFVGKLHSQSVFFFSGCADETAAGVPSDMPPGPNPDECWGQKLDTVSVFRLKLS